MDNVMTSYKAECLLISLLKNDKIDANITAGGVNIFYKRHQRKYMIDTLNGMGDALDRVTFYIYQCNNKPLQNIPNHFCAIAQGWTLDYQGRWHDKNSNFMSFAIAYYPTTNATQCDEIQDSEKIGVIYRIHALDWYAQDNNGGSHGYGTTAKRAIIACFVKSKLGEEVDCE